jgi:NADH-quinone oxidoreductase subunit H
MAWKVALATGLVVFPGMLLLIVLAFLWEWLDRKFVARLQNRHGPLHIGPAGMLQPVADFIKLLAKEDIEPAMADKAFFRVTPLLLLALPMTALLYVPMGGMSGLAHFQGDLILVMFILALVVMTIFFAGWGSADTFSIVGAMRSAIQMLAYEVPLNLALMGPVLAARSLSISDIVAWQSANGRWLILSQPLGFAVVVVSLMAELELTPFDIPEAETEIVAGWQTEFSGRKLALIRLGEDVELVLASSLLVALYLGGAAGPIPALGVLWFLIKAIVVVFLFSNLRAVFARFRIDQMVTWCWKYLVPAGIAQIIVTELMLI